MKNQDSCSEPTILEHDYTGCPEPARLANPEPRPPAHGASEIENERTEAANMHQFDGRFFCIVPNALLALVQEGKIADRDVFTYAYLRDLIGPKEYTLREVEEMATDLGKSVSAVKGSLSRLRKAGVIRRVRTIRNSKTFLVMRRKTRSERVREILLRSRYRNRSLVDTRLPQRLEIHLPNKDRLN